MGLLWRTEYKSDSEKTTTKSTEQLDLCHCWQQTNHWHPYLNMCPRPNSLLTQSRRAEESRERIWFSHMTVVRISLPATQSSPTFPSQEAFYTPPHSFLAIHSWLSSAFYKETRLITLWCLNQPVDLQFTSTSDHTYIYSDGYDENE